MFGRIRDWFHARHRAKAREIFSYWDGKRTRKIDPFVALRQLDDHPEFQPQHHGKMAEKGDQKAMHVIADAAAKAFDLLPLDDGGLTEGECVIVLSQFYTWLNTLKKNSNGTPTSPSLTDATPSSKPAEADLVSSSNSDSGSIGAEPSFATQEG